MNLLDFIYSIYFNIRYLPFAQAIKLPIWVSTNLHEIKLKRGQLVLKKPKFRSIAIGMGKSPGIQAHKAGILIGNGGKIVFAGSAVISQGTVLRCDKNSIIEFGDNFYCNSDCYMRSRSSIKFGVNCSLGWCNTLNTFDGHAVFIGNEQRPVEAPISIGNHVWITNHCIISKGVLVSDDSVIAQGSLVNKQFCDPNVLIGGVPAKIVKQNINWSHIN